MPVEIDRSRSAVNRSLRVVARRGALRLDAESVNYSFGELHDVLRGAFDSLQLADGSLNRVLLLGLGGGSAVRLLRSKLAPGGRFRAVEVDPAVVELARKHFPEARDPAVEIVVADAAGFIHNDREFYDLILVDVFIDDVTPEPLRTVEFLRSAAGRLTPRGVLVYNCLANNSERQGEMLLFRERWRAAFGPDLEFEVHGNVVFAHRGHS